MRGNTSLQKEDSFLVLDIYLGGVGAAIVHDNDIKRSSHHKTSIPSENIIPTLLTKTESLLQKTLEEIFLDTKIIQTYVFVDAPLSYTESTKLLFQKDDQTFFDTITKEITNDLELPHTYKAILGDYIKDGVVFEHPPHSHTINGYPTKNLKQEGEREAQVDQQWIQREVFAAVNRIKNTFPLGKITFLTNNHIDTLFLGDVISTLSVGSKNIVIGTGETLSITQTADTYKHPVTHIESILKGIERSHGVKDFVYKNIEKEFVHAFSNAFTHNEIIDHKNFSCTFVGQAHFLPIVQDALTSFTHIIFDKIYTGKNSRLSYILKNKVK